MPLTNNEALRPEALSIVSTIMRRIKPLKTILPCSVILQTLVKSDPIPFCCNISLSLLDIGVANIPPDSRSDCAFALLIAIDAFPKRLSPQTSSLMQYVLEFLDELPQAVKSSSVSKECLVFVYSWLLDLVLVAPGLRRDTIGSVLPGLSADRVARLTKTHETWPSAEITSLKLRIIKLISTDWMDSRFVAAISIVCCNESGDEEIAKYGTFKINGLISDLRNRYMSKTINVRHSSTSIDVDNDSEVVDEFVSIVLYMISLMTCGYTRPSIPQDTMKANNNIHAECDNMSLVEYTIRKHMELTSSYSFLVNINSEEFQRTFFREEIYVHMMHWIEKEAAFVLTRNGNNSVLLDYMLVFIHITLCHKQFKSYNLVIREPSVKFVSLVCTLLNLVIKQLNNVALISNNAIVNIAASCVRQVLESYSAVNSSSDQNEFDIRTKQVLAIIKYTIVFNMWYLTCLIVSIL